MRPPKQVWHRLQWRLALMYTVTTLVTLLLIESLTLSAILIYFFANQTNLLASSVQTQAKQAIPYFIHSTPDRDELAKWLQVSQIGVSDLVAHSQQSFLAIVDKHGQVLATQGQNAPANKIVLQSRLSAQAAANLQAVLQGNVHTSAITGQGRHGELVIIVPIQETQQSVQGAFILETDQVDKYQLITSASYGNLLPLIVINVIILTLLAGLVGALFGFLTARGFTRRFTRLSLAADHWRQGDFSVVAQDTSKDELGHLMRQLNRMAEQLQELLYTRQQLATVEERNRLARDLHDSIKQQIFAVAMQVGIVRTLIGRDVEKAKKSLNDMERLVRQAQQELTTLIRELRPVALDGKDLAQALQELARQWQEQTWITATVEIVSIRELPTNIEDTLYRITQEALANVAKHSNATAVQIQLSCTQEQLMLTITDHGQGFQVRQAEGKGIGLLSMRERIQHLGGTIQIESSIGKGTQVQVTCPTVHM